MGKNQTALFIMWPKHIDELKRPHLIQEERAYKITATIELNKIDFENFIYGMDVERIYLENNARLCSIGEIFHCIKVKCKTSSTAIAVISTPEGYVRYAAYLQ